MSPCTMDKWPCNECVCVWSTGYFISLSDYIAKFYANKHLPGIFSIIFKIEVQMLWRTFSGKWFPLKARSSRSSSDWNFLWKNEELRRDYQFQRLRLLIPSMADTSFSFLARIIKSTSFVGCKNLLYLRFVSLYLCSKHLQLQYLFLPLHVTRVVFPCHVNSFTSAFFLF